MSKYVFSGKIFTYCSLECCWLLLKCLSFIDFFVTNWHWAIQCMRELFLYMRCFMSCALLSENATLLLLWCLKELEKKNIEQKGESKDGKRKRPETIMLKKRKKWNRKKGYQSSTKVNSVWQLPPSDEKKLFEKKKAEKEKNAINLKMWWCAHHQEVPEGDPFATCLTQKMTMLVIPHGTRLKDVTEHLLYPSLYGDPQIVKSQCRTCYSVSSSPLLHHV